MNWHTLSVSRSPADIVIESSWKYLGIAAMQGMWKERDLPGKVIGITDSSVSDNWDSLRWPPAS